MRWISGHDFQVETCKRPNPFGVQERASGFDVCAKCTWCDGKGPGLLSLNLVSSSTSSPCLSPFSCRYSSHVHSSATRKQHFLLKHVQKDMRQQRVRNHPISTSFAARPPCPKIPMQIQPPPIGALGGSLHPSVTASQQLEYGRDDTPTTPTTIEPKIEAVIDW